MAAALLIAAGPLVAQAPSEAPATMAETFRASAEIARQRLDVSDFAGAIADARALLAVARTPLETYTAAAMLMQASARTMDLRTEKVAIEGLRRSGLVPPQRMIELDAVLGLVHLGLGENRDAAAVLGRARAAGVRNPRYAIGHAEALSRIGDVAGSLAATRDGLQLAALSGAAIPASWYDRAIALTVQQGDAATQALWTRGKLAAYRTPADWRSGLMAYLPRLGADTEANLDVYRLLQSTGGLATERDWLAYAAAAERTGALAEAQSAIQAGQAKGAIRTGDPVIVRQLAGLRARIGKTQAGLAARATAALKASGGAAAFKSGDELLAAGQHQRAAELYRAAIGRGGIAVDRAQLRLGIALARAGDLDGARSAWAQVTTGPVAPIAAFWSTWAEGLT